MSPVSLLIYLLQMHHLQPMQDSLACDRPAILSADKLKPQDISCM
jgi:hypothetical protein